MVQSGAAFGIKIATGIASFVLFALIARLLGASDFGAFSVLFSIAMIAGIGGSFGQQMFLVKETVVARTRGDTSHELGTYIHAASATTILGAICATCVAVLAYAGGLAASWSVAITVGLLTFAYAATQTTIGVLRVQKRVLLAIGSRDLAWRLICVAGVAALAYFSDRSVSSVILVMAMSLVAILVWHLAITVPHIIRLLQHSAPSFLPRRWLELSAGLALIAVISGCDLYLFTTAVGMVAQDAQTGAFFAAMKTVEFLNLFLLSVTLVVAPMLSQAVAEQDRSRLQRYCNSATVLQALPSIISGVIIIAAAPFFMWVYDPGYVEYAHILQILALGFLVNALTGAAGLLLQVGGMHWYQVVIQGAALAVGLALLPWLVSIWGLTGAALAFVFSKVAWRLLAAATIRKRLGVDSTILALASRRGGGIVEAFKLALADRTL